MKDYHKNKEFVYLNCWDINNFYGWAIPQKLPLDGVGWVQNTSQFKKDFIEKYKEDSDEGHFLEIDIYYPEKFYGFHNDLNCLPKRMKVERVGKLIANLHDKKENVIHIPISKQALNYRLVSKSA